MRDHGPGSVGTLIRDKSYLGPRGSIAFLETPCVFHCFFVPLFGPPFRLGSAGSAKETAFMEGVISIDVWGLLRPDRTPTLRPLTWFGQCRLLAAAFHVLPIQISLTCLRRERTR